MRDAVYMTATGAFDWAGAMMQPVAQRHHVVSGTLALIKYLVIYTNVKQGSDPDRGQSPVGWGDFPSVRPSRLALRHDWLGLRPAWQAFGPGGDIQIDVLMDGKYPHSAGLCPLSGSLPKNDDSRQQYPSHPSPPINQ